MKKWKTKLNLFLAAHFSLHYCCSIGSLSVTWWERNFSMTRGTKGSEKGHFAHLLHLQSPNSSNSLLPLSNIISFSLFVWVLTKCGPTAMFFPLEETGKPELSFPCWCLHWAMFVLVYFCTVYSSVNSVTFTCPAHLQIHHYQLLACLPSLCHHQERAAHSLLLHIKSTLEGLLLLFRSLHLHTELPLLSCFHMGNHILDILF